MENNQECWRMRQPGNVANGMLAHAPAGQRRQ
jgi:hypothetical protein